jgi:hypothetical protein
MGLIAGKCRRRTHEMDGKHLKEISNRFISMRPELLTAVFTFGLTLATVALVITTIYLVIAADRQERATFDTNRYSKQIEYIARSLQDFILLDDEMSDLHTTLLSIRVNEGDKIQNIEDKLASSKIAYFKWRQNLPALFLILPEQYWEQVSKIDRIAETVLGHISNVELPAIKMDLKQGKDPAESAEHFANYPVPELIQRFIGCAAAQLRMGKYLTSLSECPNELPKFQ